MPDGFALRPEDPAELGGHRILRRLGEGGQGVVYLGRGPSGEHVAIKLLHARMAADPGARDRFVRELSAAKTVARFCTAQVLDADVAGDHPYIVSEYVEGRSLRSHILDEGPRTGGALERLAIATLTALAAIHKAGVVHRDFTPHNVLLGPDGPRVIDFGIARALGAVRNDDTNSVGTPSYMAPEQVSGGEIGPPADMFAWGSTILFAATGNPPFGNDAVNAVMERIMDSEPDMSALPEPLRTVVASCLAKDPAGRPSAQEAQAGLLGDEATEALMPPPAFGAADFHHPIAPTTAAIAAGQERAATPQVPARPTRRIQLPAAPLVTRVPISRRPPAEAPPAEAPPAEAPAAGAPAAGAPTTGASASPAGGPVLTPVSAPGLGPVAAGRPVSGGWLRPRVGWAVLAGATVVVAGAAVAVPLWPDGGDAATAPRTRVTAVPATPTPTPATSLTPRPQLNGLRTGVVTPVKPKHTKRPAKACRDYRRTYSMSGTGTVLLHVSVCRDAYTGNAVLGDTAPKDGWDVCLQLRGHLTGPGPAAYVSTTVTSRDGRIRDFENGPKTRFGPKTTRTEDSLTVNAGRCRGSGTDIQTSWKTRDQLAAG